jgi:hypothetical protein
MVVMPAPIVLFAYNRPDHTAATLNALAANDLAAESDITIFCDGARTPEQNENTARVRAVAHAARGFRKVTVVERAENFGLARSVITGITSALADSENVIVMEDDLITSPHFLRFMNDGLERYAADERVISVCGYTYPVAGPLPETFFIPRAFCWGWATWRRGWALFEHDATRVFNEIVRRRLIYEFDFEGTDPHTQILEHLLKDKWIDSWAIRWLGASCLNGKVSLYAGRSLVSNIGFDGTGRHGFVEKRFESPLAESAISVRGDAPVTDRRIIELHRQLFARWRAGSSRKRALYYQLTFPLPRSIQKALYTALIRRSLRIPAAT